MNATIVAPPLVPGLLEQLTRRFDGLITTGTLIVAGSVSSNPRSFVDSHVEVLRSLVIVLRALLPNEVQHLNSLLGDIDDLGHLLSQLPTDRTVIPELESVAGRMAQAIEVVSEAAQIKGRPSFMLDPRARRGFFASLASLTPT